MKRILLMAVVAFAFLCTSVIMPVSAQTSSTTKPKTTPTAKVKPAAKPKMKTKSTSPTKKRHMKKHHHKRVMAKTKAVTSCAKPMHKTKGVTKRHMRMHRTKGTCSCMRHHRTKHVMRRAPMPAPETLPACPPVSPSM